jgi:hypothetical protein
MNDDQRLVDLGAPALVPSSADDDSCRAGHRLRERGGVRRREHRLGLDSRHALHGQGRGGE